MSYFYIEEDKKGKLSEKLTNRIWSKIKSRAVKPRLNEAINPNCGHYSCFSFICSPRYSYLSYNLIV